MMKSESIGYNSGTELLGYEKDTTNNSHNMFVKGINEGGSC